MPARARDAERLAASSNSKEAQGLESELASLARRKSDLEDAELEVMERLEQADAAVAEQEALIAETNAEGAELSAEAKRVVAEATAAFERRHAIGRPSPPDRRPISSRSTTGSRCAARAPHSCVARTCEGMPHGARGHRSAGDPPGAPTKRS